MPLIMACFAVTAEPDLSKQNHKSIFLKTGHNLSPDEHVDKRWTSIKLLPVKRKLEKEFKKQNIKRIFKFVFQILSQFFRKKKLTLPVLTMFNLSSFQNFIYYFIEVFEKVPDCRGGVRGHGRSLRLQDGVWIFRASYHTIYFKTKKKLELWI